MTTIQGDHKWPFKQENKHIYARRGFEGQAPLPPHSTWGIDGRPFIRQSWGANSAGKKLLPPAPSSTEILEETLPTTAAAALREEFRRTRAFPDVSISLPSTGRELPAEAVQGVAGGFVAGDPGAFQQAVRGLAGLEAAQGERGAAALGEALARALGPLVDRDPDAAARFVQQSVPPHIWSKGVGIAMQLKSQFAEKAERDAKRAHQEELYQRHMRQKEAGGLHAAERYFGPDTSIYTVVQLSSSAETWEWEGVKTEIPFPGYGFSCHQVFQQYEDGANGLHEMDLTKKVDWSELFVGPASGDIL